MKWMETIRVQSATGKDQTTLRELIFLKSEIKRDFGFQGLRDVMVSSHVSIPGCFVLMLFWDTDNPQAKGSPIGMSLAQSLKNFGLVDHSVWIENHK
ncbi:MAG: hypothetical protein JW932_10535 [Deltaproteobacteria bacterium]|nr:hypothetical protein [Deltaproteobacteria bacterium]